MTVFFLFIIENLPKIVERNHLWSKVPAFCCVQVSARTSQKGPYTVGNWEQRAAKPFTPHVMFLTGTCKLGQAPDAFTGSCHMYVRCVRLQRRFLTSCGPPQQLKHINTGGLVVSICPIMLMNAAVTVSLAHAHCFLSFFFYFLDRNRAIAHKFYSIMAGSTVVFV